MSLNIRKKVEKTENTFSQIYFTSTMHKHKFYTPVYSDFGFMPILKANNKRQLSPFLCICQSCRKSPSTLCVSFHYDVT